MKKMQLSQKYVITMYDYLVNYCQLREEKVFTYCNFPHERIKEVISDSRIAQFPFQCYQEEFSYSGFVLLVEDCTGKKLPYINPLLLGSATRGEIINRLLKGTDWQLLLERLIIRADRTAIPVTYEPVYEGTTHKKSHQKKMDYKRRRKEDEEYKRR